jgi:hypothetical protein
MFFCVAYVSRSVCIQKVLEHFSRELKASSTNWLIWIISLVGYCFIKKVNSSDLYKFVYKYGGVIAKALSSTIIHDFWSIINRVVHFFSTCSIMQHYGSCAEKMYLKMSKKFESCPITFRIFAFVPFWHLLIWLNCAFEIVCFSLDPLASFFSEPSAGSNWRWLGNSLLVQILSLSEGSNGVSFAGLTPRTNNVVEDLKWREQGFQGNHNIFIRMDHLKTLKFFYNTNLENYIQRAMFA